jgi:quinol monooxygenase YgiN
MTFVQVIEFDTSREQEVQVLMDQWRSETEGTRTATHAWIARDHTKPNHYATIVEFPSYEEAMRNSEMPQTQAMAERMAELCDAPPRFLDLDVIREDT